MAVIYRTLVLVLFVGIHCLRLFLENINRGIDLFLILEIGLKNSELVLHLHCIQYLSDILIMWDSA